MTTLQFGFASQSENPLPCATASSSVIQPPSDPSFFFWQCPFLSIENPPPHGAVVVVEEVDVVLEVVVVFFVVVVLEVVVVRAVVVVIWRVVVVVVAERRDGVKKRAAMLKIARCQAPGFCMGISVFSQILDLFSLSSEARPVKGYKGTLLEIECRHGLR